MATDPVQNAAPNSGLLRLLDGVEGGLSAFEKGVAALSMLVILLGIVVMVVARVTNLPLPATGELAIVAMSPLTFIGGAFCTYMHRHITIDAVEALGSPAVRRVVRVLASMAMALFAGLYSWLAFSFFEYVWSSGERLIDMGTPVWIPVVCIVLGSVLMMVHSALDVVRLTLGLPRTGAMS